MSLITWQESYATGIADVDHEHQQLISLINELYEQMQLSDDREKVLQLLEEILTQISAHFSLEEKFMRDREYDQYQDHKQDHELLLDELRDVMDAYELEGQYNDVELAMHLNAWFSEHFASHDARLHNKLGAHE
jgi:hemerythrin